MKKTITIFLFVLILTGCNLEKNKSPSEIQEDKPTLTVISKLDENAKGLLYLQEEIDNSSPSDWKTFYYLYFYSKDDQSPQKLAEIDVKPLSLYKNEIYFDAPEGTNIVLTKYSPVTSREETFEIPEYKGIYQNYNGWFSPFGRIYYEPSNTDPATLIYLKEFDLNTNETRTILKTKDKFENNPKEYGFLESDKSITYPDPNTIKINAGFLEFGAGRLTDYSIDLKSGKVSITGDHSYEASCAFLEENCSKEEIEEAKKELEEINIELSKQTEECEGITLTPSSRGGYEFTTKGGNKITTEIDIPYTCMI